MRIVFMGSPDFAVPALEALVAAGHDLACAYTQPPRRAGRGKSLQPTAVERKARDLGIEVRSPTSLRSDEAQADFAALRPEIAVVAAYGLILPQPILDTPPMGCVNLHASLLPRWRGAAPVQRAIMAGDDWTGVTLMQMEAGLDTGPMLHRLEIEIGNSNAAELTERLAILGSDMIVELLQDPAAYPPHPQPEEGVTYASKISKEEARIDWSRAAHELERHVQGLAPFPGAWFEAEGERIKLLEAGVVEGNGAPGEVLDEQLTVACGEGALRPRLLQRAGKGRMNTGELLRGFPVAKGTILP